MFLDMSFDKFSLLLLLVMSYALTMVLVLIFNLSMFRRLPQNKKMCFQSSIQKNNSYVKVSWVLINLMLAGLPPFLYFFVKVLLISYLSSFFLGWLLLPIILVFIWVVYFSNIFSIKYTLDFYDTSSVNLRVGASLLLLVVIVSSFFFIVFDALLIIFFIV